MNRTLCIAVVVSLFTNVGSGAPLTLYVTHQGPEQTNTFHSLRAALEAARKARMAQPDEAKDGITIFVRGGLHELQAPIELTPADSGMMISAAPNEKPIVSGGRRISGWKPAPDRPSVWEATIPNLPRTNWQFRSLFVNGVRRGRARTPNEGYFRIEGASPQDKPVKLKFKAGDIKRDWAKAGQVEVVALLAWADLRMYIRDVDEASGVATLSGNPRPSNREDNARYYIENAPDGLDAAGEWQVDWNKAVVRYIPLPGEDMGKAEVTAGFLKDLIMLRGDTNNPITNVVLRGLTFAYTDWAMETNGYADTQAAIVVDGDIRAEWATHCKIENNAFAHLAGYAIELGRGCQHWEITGNEMHDLGAGGIRIGETSKRTDSADGNHSHVIRDNRIHHAGVVNPSAVGVLILQSGTNRIAHNEIHHLYYTAVSVGWNWGYQETPCRENIIEFNHLHDIGQFMLSDMGAVYTLGIQRGTVIRNNLIHDVNAFTYGGWGLYTDEGSSHIVLENNVVYRCKNAGFHQHYGRENVVRNNIFAFGKENQLMRTREEAHVSFIFTNNIVYFDSGNLLGSNWKNDRFTMDRNIYCDKRAGADSSKYTMAGSTWQQWQSRGHDVHSLIADPSFKDAEKFNFALRENSPALKLGFKPIDLSEVGPQQKP